MRNSRTLSRLVPIAAFVAIGLFSAENAHAEADTFGLGSGRTGPGTIAASTVVNAYAAITAPVGIASTNINVDDGSLFAPGDMVLIWETTGISSATLGDLTATDLSASTAGTYEFGRVKSVAANVVTLTNPTISAYAGVAQLVRVPEYTTLDITAGGIAATPWDGAKGGIAVVFANGAVTNAGVFDTSTFGFRGGVLLNDATVFGCTGLEGPVVDSLITPGLNVLAGGAKKGEGLFTPGYNTDTTNATSATNLVTYGRGNLSNGAGGGDCHNSGGGGGGHGGAGGQGGGTWAGETDLVLPTPDRMVGGIGGTSVNYSPTTHLVFGGGAGAGEENNDLSTPGGSGGGVLLLRAASISGAGSFISDGASGGAAGGDGAGGGGAGGLIVVQSAGNADCAAVHANGGAGGTAATDHGPGAGGGGGVIYFQAAGGTCAALATEAGGAKGTDGAALDRGATAGAGGVTATTPAGGFTPTGCDIAGGNCGGCVLDIDCPSGDICNSTNNTCEANPDAGAGDGGLDGGSNDGGLGDGGLGDGGLSDGGLTDGGNGDGGSRDGGGLDGGGTGDGGSFGDGGGNGDGGNGNGLTDDGSLEGGGCGCSTPGSSEGGNAGAFAIAAMAALAFARRKKKR